jgi:hypothetical protein
MKEWGRSLDTQPRIEPGPDGQMLGQLFGSPPAYPTCSLALPRHRLFFLAQTTKV